MEKWKITFLENDNQMITTVIEGDLYNIITNSIYYLPMIHHLGSIIACEKIQKEV